MARPNHMLTWLFPLVLLAFAMATFWLAQQTGQDVYRVLAIGGLVICLIWGCAIAPWFLQLPVLIFLASWRVWRSPLKPCK